MGPPLPKAATAGCWFDLGVLACSKSSQYLDTKIQPTLAPFLSVFLLTRTGFSYLTNDAVGGIILSFIVVMVTVGGLP